MTTSNNVTTDTLDSGDLNFNDAAWVLSSAFIIFTMQTGFGMLESGCVTAKNEVNIMMKNIVDIVMGGSTYWLFGYALSFGKGAFSNPFIGLGDFLTDVPLENPLMGQGLTAFLFQLSFATTATTIVGGAMAERTNFKAYIIFSLLNTIVYCIPAGWVWGEHGFLNSFGAVDIAGGGPVHLIGGASAFASAVMLGPRLGRYANGKDPLPMGNPVNLLLGFFLLWWGWLVFNSGSTYGITEGKWQYSARAAVTTMLGSFGGGVTSCIYSMWQYKGRVDVITMVNGILGSLVSITAGCFLFRTWEAIIIGAIGALLCILAMPLFDKFYIDDPVGASAVHGVCGIWGLLAIGLFADNPISMGTTKGRMGLFKGGGWSLLGIQSVTCLCLVCWGILVTFFILYIINIFIPIRMDEEEELLGADFSDHRIENPQLYFSRALAQLKKDFENATGVKSINGNTELYIDQIVHPTNSNGQLSGDTQMSIFPRKNITKRNNLERSENVVISNVGGVFKSKDLETPTHSNGKNNPAFSSSE